MHLRSALCLPSGRPSRSRARPSTALPVVFALAAFALSGCDKKDQPSPAPANTGSEPPAPASTGGPAPASATPETEPRPPGNKVKSFADGLVAELGQELGGVLEKEFGGVANELAGLVDDRPALSDDEYRKLVLAYAECAINEDGSVDRDCPAVKAKRDAVSGKTFVSNLAGGRQALGVELLEHPSPAVRLEATKLVGSILGLGDLRARVLAFAQKETHPAVLAELIAIIGSSAHKEPPVAALMERHAGHESALVRKAVVSAWATRENQQVAATRERAHAMTRSDASDDVRAAGCTELGETGHAEHMPLYRAMLADTSLAESLRVACLNGLVQMWFDWPFLRNGNEEAYRLTLAMWNATPRTSLRSLRIPGFHHEPHGFAEWRARATWFDPTEVRSALVELVADPAVDWMVRTGALRNVVHLGASREELTALRGRISAGPSGSSFVIKDLDAAIAKAPAGGTTVVEGAKVAPRDPTPDDQPLVAAGAVGVGAAGALAAGAGRGGGKFEVGQAVQILWNDNWYAGAVLEVGEGRWKIRYDGYSESWDEWVGSDRLKAQ